ncbi:ABC transporter permease [Lapillicoccus jejuensis]|uniref:Transport permease protein n=1 Tax=Lapillicoccus jejuensis TaxID=402171 RepID=A0A542DW28_9MICO|nr:ABC transporter permease [Lapillicoccus jejuensis]TQJ07256.1 ABC-2 type transport system permease protein [Lapillicoccus jejuensis]
MKVATLGRATRRSGPQTSLRGELVAQLVRKDLKVKYQGSTLGFMWSLANPLLTLVVYTFVFTVVFPSRVPKFGFFLMSGLLIWNFFSLGVSGAATSILGNAGLVKKVPFPHSALPLAAIGFAGVQVVLQYVVLIIALSVGGMAPLRPELLLLVPATFVALVFTVGLGMFVAATTVRLRDTQHILEVALFAWLYVTPIIYQVSLVHDRFGGGLVEKLYYLNPMTGVVISFQRALYGQVYYPGTDKLLLASADDLFYLKALAVGFVVSAVVFLVGRWQFRRLSADFAEEL